VHKPPLNAVRTVASLAAATSAQSRYPTGHDIAGAGAGSAEARCNRVDQWGWIFTRTTGLHDEVFVAIRICEGGYTTSPTTQAGVPTGNALRCDDGTAPVVIEVASGAEYPGPTGFDDFKSAAQ
jgi:hypothetical protein